MPDLYTAVPGGMPTGWLKKISLLEKQVAELQRDIREIKQSMKKLEDPWAGKQNPLDGLIVGDTSGQPVIKRGPGRPRKNPQ